ncbi:MAG: hypothetical protein H7Y86_15775 [Rhizobacter sp.]|nr:hypothetical protein [Ferruginibacter sp.]
MISRKWGTALVYSLIIISCNAQSPQNDKAFNDELIKRELANQENAKKGNQYPQIEVITDPAKVEKLGAAVLKKIQLKDKAEVAALAKNSAPWQRYKLHDKTSVTTLLSILKGNDARKRIEVYKGLAPDYNDQANYAITEPELVEQLLKAVENPEDEEAAIQLAGIVGLKGFEAVFEKRLLSGKSRDEGRIIFWLGKTGKSKPAFDYMEAAIRSKRLNGSELDNAISGLGEFAKNADAAIKKRAGALAMFIYQEKLITTERYEDLKNSAYTSDAAEIVLQLIFDYADKSSVPVAYDILNRNIRTLGPVKALIRLEGAKHIDKVYAYLKSEDDFFKGLDLVEELDNSLVTPALLKEVMLQLSKQKEVPDYVLSRIIDFYKKKNAVSFLEQPGSIITDQQLATRITDRYKRSMVSSEAIVKDLLDPQIISAKPRETILAKLESEAAGDPLSFAFALMDQQQIHFAFDTETGFVPVDYDKLLLEFAARSKGILKDLKVWMDATGDRNGETFSYTITALCNNKVFVARPRDMGDWYDIMTIDALLNKLLADLGARERFVSIETGDQMSQYIFGDPEKVNLFLKKYK